MSYNMIDVAYYIQGMNSIITLVFNEHVEETRNTIDKIPITLEEMIYRTVQDFYKDVMRSSPIDDVDCDGNYDDTLDFDTEAKDTFIEINSCYDKKEEFLRLTDEHLKNDWYRLLQIMMSELIEEVKARDYVSDNIA